MYRIFVAASLVLTSCATPIDRNDVDERLSYWNSDVKRFMHMHSSEYELRSWLDQRGIEYSNLAQGPGFVALLDSVHETGERCPINIYLVGAVKGIDVLWYRVEAKKRPDCDDDIDLTLSCTCYSNIGSKLAEAIFPTYAGHKLA